MHLWKFKNKNYNIFYSKVARRIFFIFIFCSLFPLTILAYFSFSEVTKQFNYQANRRLHQITKAAGMTIVERLLFLQADIKTIIANIQNGIIDIKDLATHKFSERLKDRFSSIIFVTDNNRPIASIGSIQNLPQLSIDERQHIKAGKTLIIVRPSTGKFAKIFMIRAIDLARPTQGLLFGEIQQGYLWGGEGFLIPMTEFFVLSQTNDVLFSSFPEYFPLQELDDAMREDAPSRQFSWTYEGNTYLASFRRLFMSPRFFTNWILIHSQSSTDIHRPLANFKKVFLLIAVLAFLVVSLLSLFQIRRSTIPIKLLLESTRRVAAKDFGSPVRIKSNDEFEELGESFNQMVNNLLISQESLQHLNIELSLAYDKTIEGWSKALDMRDKETEGHSQRVTEMTVCIALTFGIKKDEELIHIRRGALLHDIGKMGIPDSILLKPGKLTEEEWTIMKLHPVTARNLLYPIEFLGPALDIPYCHHEKWDGTGYPRGLKGEEIPIAARIFAVVDFWDALRSDRPYRPAWPNGKVLEHIRSLAGTHFDPKVVEIFLKMVL